MFHFLNEFTLYSENGNMYILKYDDISLQQFIIELNNLNMYEQ